MTTSGSHGPAPSGAAPGGPPPRNRRRIVVVDVESDPPDVDLSGHDSVAAVVRASGRPIRLVAVSAVDGSLPLTPSRVLPGRALRERVRSDLALEVWEAGFEARVRERLGGAWWRHLPRPTTTVAVCTRDRPEHLAGCLQALAALDPAPEEVLVIDNAPRVPCREVVEGYGFRYVVEERPGLDNARNRAIRECATDVIAFTDDDCRPEPRWLADLAREFAHPLTMAVTGVGFPYRLDTPHQLAFEEAGGFMKGLTRRVVDWTTLPPADAGQVGAGANMAFRAGVLRQLGGFPPELDAGTPTRSGGDTYALSRILACGGRVVYSPSQMVWHDHRADLAELRRVMRGYGTGLGAMSVRSLLAHGEIDSVRAGSWPLRNLFRRLGDLGRGRASLLGVAAAAEMARGNVESPARWAQALRAGSPMRSEAPVAPSPSAASPVRRGAGVAPRISVVIPTAGRRPAALAQCVAALADQTLPRDDYEILVVANGDDGRHLTDVPGADRVVHRAEPGASGARNHGAEVAAGEFLVFMDDDIVAGRGCLAAHLARLDGEACATLGPAYPPATGRGLAHKAAALWWYDHYERKHRRGHRFSFVDVLTGNLGIPRRDFLAVGGLDPAFAAHRREDYDLGCRLLKAGHTVRAVPDAVAWHHYEMSSHRMLRERFSEGYGDVLLTGRHPEAYAALPLRRVAPMRGGQRWRVSVAVGDAVATGAAASPASRALDALEGARLRRRWARAMRALGAMSYIAGVERALADGHPLAVPTIAATVIDLDAAEAIGDAVAHGDVVLRLAGQDIGTVALPDGQWDDDAIVDQAVRLLVTRALVAEAVTP